MISETLLQALQERMRKLTNASATHAVRDAELRAAVERARMTDAAEAAQEAAAVERSDQLAKEVRALRDHVNDLMSGREESALVTGLKEEVSELENKRNEILQQIEQLRSHRREVLDNAIKELEAAEQQRRYVADQAMRLREHIEKIVHGRNALS